MSSIGAQSFIGVYGVVNKDRQQVVDISQPFVHGSAFQRIGRRAIPSQIETSVDAANQATASGIVRSYESMVGTVVTIVNYGESKPNCLVLDVQCRITPGVNGNGGLNNGSFIVDAIWTVQFLGPVQ